jgi:hypothetical protein
MLELYVLPRASGLPCPVETLICALRADYHPNEPAGPACAKSLARARDELGTERVVQHVAYTRVEARRSGMRVLVRRRRSGPARALSTQYRARLFNRLGSCCI